MWWFIFYWNLALVVPWFKNIFSECLHCVMWSSFQNYSCSLRPLEFLANGERRNRKTSIRLYIWLFSVSSCLVNEAWYTEPRREHLKMPRISISIKVVWNVCTWCRLKLIRALIKLFCLHIFRCCTAVLVMSLQFLCMTITFCYNREMFLLVLHLRNYLILGSVCSKQDSNYHCVRQDRLQSSDIRQQCSVVLLFFLVLLVCVPVFLQVCCPYHHRHTLSILSSSTENKPAMSRLHPHLPSSCLYCCSYDWPSSRLTIRRHCRPPLPTSYMSAPFPSADYGKSDSWNSLVGVFLLWFACLWSWDAKIIWVVNMVHT